MELIHGTNFDNLSKKKQKEKLYRNFKHIWKSKITCLSKGFDYYNFKADIKFEPYLQIIKNRKHSVSLTKLRLSDQKLAAETGRHVRNVKLRKERLCHLCQLQINSGAS